MKIFALIVLPILFLSSCTEEKHDSFNGYVEGKFTMISPTKGGILNSLYVSRGDKIAPNSSLFALDITELETQRISAISDITRLTSEVNNAKSDYARALTLSKSGVNSKAKFEDSKTKLVALESYLEKAKQLLIQVEYHIQNSSPSTKEGGVIQNIFYNLGEYVPKGKPVISILEPKKLKIRFFVPQKYLSKISLGEYVFVEYDSSIDLIPAKISYIASNAEYTPPIIYSLESRDKLVFLVEALPQKYNEFLHTGLPVTIKLDDTHDK